jgi:hypothetical protein
MGGVAGHLAHLYDNRDLTYNKMAKILSLASTGQLEFIEKADGYNIYLGFKDGTTRWARNKGDMSQGGRNMDELIAREFAGGESVKKVYVEAFEAFEAAVKSLSKNDIEQIFGPEGEVFYNSEIMGPSAEQLVNYDRNIIAIHHGGHKLYNLETNSVEVVDASANSKKLDAVIDKFEEATTGKSFSVQRTAVAKLKQLGNDEDLKIALAKIRKAGLAGQMTIEEYLEVKLRLELDNRLSYFSDQIKQDVIDRILKKTDQNGKPAFRGAAQIYKGFPKEQKTVIGDIIKEGPSLLSEAIFPIEEAIHDFAVELLKGMESAYILDNHKELARLRRETEQAIKNIVSYTGEGAEEAQGVLAKQLKKIKHHDNINSTVEGVVFEYEGQLYKFTGNFAPINQILGLFKYGRGNVPPIRRTEEQSERLREEEQDTGERQWTNILENVNSLVLVPGGFKPPHRGHVEMVQNYSGPTAETSVEHIIIMMAGPAQRKPRSIKGKPITFELSRQIWDIYLRDAGITNYTIMEADAEYQSSPVRMAYTLLEDAHPGQTIYMACGQKGKDPTRFAAAGNAQEEGVKVITTPCPVVTHRGTGENLSATFLREYIDNNNFDEFLEYVPDSSLKHAEEVFTLLGGERGLQESLSDAIFRWVEESLDEISTAAGGFEGGSRRKKKRQQPIIMREEEPNESEDELEEEIYRYIANNLSI